MSASHKQLSEPYTAEHLINAELLQEMDEANQPKELHHTVTTKDYI
jgi:hypothetical protein